MDLPAPVSPVSTDKPGREVDVEPVDQDDIANREPGQHARLSLIAFASGSRLAGTHL